MSPEELSARMKAIRPRQPARKHAVTLPVDPDTLARYEQRIIQAAPHMGQARFDITRTLLARVLIRVDRVDEWYARGPRAWFLRSTSSGKASMQAIEQRYASLIEQARRLAETAGLTPSSAKALGIDPQSPDAKDLTAFLHALPKGDSQ